MSRILSAPAKYAFCAMNSQINKLPTHFDDYLTIRIPDHATVGAAPVGQGVLQDEDFAVVTPGTPFYGSLTPVGDTDFLSFAVTAGETYTVSLRGSGANGVNDTLLGVLDANGNVVDLDDDGGIGISSLITFTATTTGTYSVYADSFDTGGVGDYRVDIRAESATPDIGDTFVTATTLNFDDLVIGFIGDQTGPYEDFGDVDTYKITLQAGQYYTFQLAGGADYNTIPQNVPAGELDTALLLYDAQGNLVAANDDLSYPSDISSGVSFLATQSGTFYLDVTAYAGQRGGYTLLAHQVDLASLDPLDSIRWVNAANIPTVNNVATVYFAAAGDSLGQLADDGTSPLIAYGWNDYEKGQVMAALAEYTTITGITYQITTDESSATFRLQTTTSANYGAYFYPNDPGYGDETGIGVFNVASGGWSLPGQASLEQGGYAFGVMLHEFGHAHGLAHPHDTGGGSDIMVGVNGPDSLGIFDLNQGVYTVMSYNDAWETNPDGPSPYTRDTVGYGWSGGLSAFDIAVLQERYGVHAYAETNTTYTIKDSNTPGTYYEAIWDTGGIDEIRYDGARNARIDLLAATLDYSPTGGGVVSFVDGVFGGYTIANGVMIENASGGSGSDVLLGNAGANMLLGNAGFDMLMGRDGDDYLDGGLDSDTLDGGAGNDRIVYDATDYRVTGGDGGDTLILRSGASVNLANIATTQIAGAFVFGFENVDASASSVGVTLTGSEYGNTLVGGSGGDIIMGGAGSDILQGNAGNDTLDGGIGADTVDGGAGNDRIVYDATDHSLSGGAGDDTLVLRGAATVNLGNFSTTQIAGKSVFGFENVDASGSSAAVTLTGSAFDNVLTGGSAGDTLRGGGGSDALNGGAGTDQLFGDAGDDIINGGAGADRIEGGAGNDRIYYDAADFTVSGGDGTDTLMLFGGATVNLGNFSTSQVAGKSVFGFENVDASGSSAAVTLSGSAFDNVLIGGSGADTLRGGGGYDRLTGGSGADRFMFDTLASASTGRTTITDFGFGDKIDLSGIDAVSGGADNAFAFIGNAAFHGIAGELRYSAGSGGQIVQGDVNGDGIADFSILLVTGSIQQDYFIL